jgi:hypothetical protein
MIYYCFFFPPKFHRIFVYLKIDNPEDIDQSDTDSNESSGSSIDSTIIESKDDKGGDNYTDPMEIDLRQKLNNINVCYMIFLLILF